MDLLKKPDNFIIIFLVVSIIIILVARENVPGWELPAIGAGSFGLGIGMKFNQRIWKLLYKLGIEEKKKHEVQNGDTGKEENYTEIK